METEIREQCWVRASNLLSNLGALNICTYHLIEVFKDEKVSEVYLKPLTHTNTLVVEIYEKLYAFRQQLNNEASIDEEQFKCTYELASTVFMTGIKDSIDALKDLLAAFPHLQNIKINNLMNYLQVAQKLRVKPLPI